MASGKTASDPGTRGRVVGVWGPGADAWTGEERQRAAGFPIDPSGRQRVLGFPAGPPAPINFGWLRSIAHPVRSFQRRDRRRPAASGTERPGPA